ncbi:hypothetical protein JL720_16227 [Aureococcus anophagefferens]|nr:hypothetical protein JL720_16227 [Aureococcus anophagefferens]
MAEVYATMDKAAADGMKTSSDKTAAVTDAWARVRSDATAIDWAAFVLEGKAYKLRAEGSARRAAGDLELPPDETAELAALVAAA